MPPRALHGSGSARGTSVSASRCEVMRSTIELWKTTLCSSHALKPADARWRPQEQLSLPPLVRDWLADPGSLTARLRLYGAFRVVPRDDRIIRPTLAEQQLLGHIGRQRALVREVPQVHRWTQCLAL